MLGGLGGEDYRPTRLSARSTIPLQRNGPSVAASPMRGFHSVRRQFRNSTDRSPMISSPGGTRSPNVRTEFSVHLPGTGGA